MTSEIFLDTSTAIDRIFNPETQRAIDAILDDEKVISTSTYVLMEFKRTVLKDCIYLYSMIEEEESLTDVYYRLKEISDSPNERIAQRCIMILKSLEFPKTGKETDKKQVLNQLKVYIKFLLIKSFLNGLNLIESDTKCTIARNKPKKIGGNKYWIDLDCNGPNKCEIEEYIYNHTAEFRQILESLPDSPDLKYIYEGINILLTKPERAREGCCKRIGDAIVTIDAPSASIILSSDEHFNYICPAIGKRIEFL